MRNIAASDYDPTELLDIVPDWLVKILDKHRGRIPPLLSLEEAKKQAREHRPHLLPLLEDPEISEWIQRRILNPLEEYVSGEEAV